MIKNTIIQLSWCRLRKNIVTLEKQKNTVYGWYVVELCTSKVYNFGDQCHPNEFNKKDKDK